MGLGRLPIANFRLPIGATPIENIVSDSARSNKSGARKRPIGNWQSKIGNDLWLNTTKALS
ncbi:MAG: hypothetical protein QOH42_2283 [Blastocatellia bacterium]|jgi:hypothetical protein|nr:hypothetical protein [Blastocatellia bacterium]